MSNYKITLDNNYTRCGEMKLDNINYEMLLSDNYEYNFAQLNDNEYSLVNKDLCERLLEAVNTSSNKDSNENSKIYIIKDEAKKEKKLRKTTLVATEDILLKAGKYLNNEELNEFKRTMTKNIESVQFKIRSKDDPDMQDNRGFIHFENNIINIREDSVGEKSKIRHELYHEYTLNGKEHINDKTGEILKYYGISISVQSNDKPKYFNKGLNEGVTEYLNDSDEYKYEQLFAKIMHYSMGNKFIKAYLKSEPDKIEKEFDEKAGDGSFKRLNNNINLNSYTFFEDLHDEGYIKPTDKQIDSGKIVAEYFYNLEKNNIQEGEYSGTKGINDISKRIVGFERLIRQIPGYPYMKKDFTDYKKQLNEMTVDKLFGEELSKVQKDTYSNKILNMQSQLSTTFKREKQEFYYTRGSKKFLLEEALEPKSALEYNKVNTTYSTIKNLIHKIIDMQPQKQVTNNIVGEDKQREEFKKSIKIEISGSIHPNIDNRKTIEDKDLSR